MRVRMWLFIVFVFFSQGRKLLTSTNHEHIRHHVFDNTVHKFDCYRSYRCGSFNVTSYSGRHNHGLYNSSPGKHRLCSYCSGCSSYPADGSCFGLPVVSVSLPQQRRLQDDGGAGSRRGPR